ncbi:peptidylprolyl isomerase [Haliangium sp.]|uniref:peptidylprolyl isomerase n=1 Tax=Haliangium sp. TaxID=2663208 RepID=UPI003D0E32DC
MHCRKGVSYDLDDDALAVVIDGEPVTAAAVELLYEPYARSGTLTRREFMHRVIGNRLIHRRVHGPGEDCADACTEADGDPAMVDDERARVREQYDRFAALLLGGDAVDAIVTDSVVSWHLPSEAENEALYRARQGRALAARKQLDHDRARAYTVARVRLPGDASETSLSYDEVYAGAALVVREELQKGSAAALRAQVRTAVRRRYVDHVSADPDHPQHRVLADVRAIIADERAARAHDLRMGFRRHEHDQGQIPERARTINDDRIRAYYQAHRDEFTQVTEVRCRHISVPDIDRAQAAHAELQAGTSFAEVVQKYSTAPDRAHDEPGLLPLIRNQSPAQAKPPFLHVLCLLHAKEPQPTPPLLTREGFEILSVDAVLEGPQSLEEATVRDKIARHLATQDLVAERERERAALMADARVRVNPRLFADEAP